jgi:hypothetical protein
MSAGIAELLLLSVAAASAFAAALFSILCFVRTRSPIPALTQETVAPILRSETEIVQDRCSGPGALATAGARPIPDQLSGADADHVRHGAGWHRRPGAGALCTQGALHDA